MMEEWSLTLFLACLRLHAAWARRWTALPASLARYFARERVTDEALAACRQPGEQYQWPRSQLWQTEKDCLHSGQRRDMPSRISDTGDPRRKKRLSKACRRRKRRMLWVRLSGWARPKGV